MGTISKIVQPVGGFQYSVNIYYDINDNNKIKSYVPSNSALQIIEDVLLSTENSATDRARILTGAYGKGKSHLILAISALLSGRDSSLFSNILDKAKQTDNVLYQNLLRHFKEGKKLLPIIVNADSLDLKSVLLHSLNESLKAANLTEFMPTTFFDAAIEKIQSWEQDFPNTYEQLKKAIGQPVEEFIQDLSVFNQRAYDRFVKLYPALTSGSEFNPVLGTNIINIFERVAKELHSVGYNGIFIVYDEFGKYLESISSRTVAQDTQFLQNLVEACARSKENQLQVLLVSHKNIENYLGGISKKNISSWKGISGRFKPLSINNSDKEIYDMVATVLHKNSSEYEKFIKIKQSEFERLRKTVNKYRSFDKIRGALTDDLAKSCYPLHPYSLLLLPKISELIAQNERTIFTFLSSNERNTVPYFLRKEDSEFPLIEPDYIYDYFEKLLKSEPYGSNIKKQWQIADTALAKVRDWDNELAEKIIKTIALIYCVNEFEVIPPSWDIIDDIYSVNYRPTEINAAKELLKTNNILIELLYKPHVRLTEGSGHNVVELIKQESYKIRSKIDCKNVLADISSAKYFYPVEYNDKNEIIRYFELRFITLSELSSLDVHTDIDSSADGIVYAVYLRDTEDKNIALKKISEIKNSRVIFILPLKNLDLDELLIEYAAIQNLINFYSGKEVALVDELVYIEEDRYKLLTNFVESTYLQPESGCSEFYNEGSIVSISRKSQFSKLLSDIMDTTYYHTPVVVNDLINKNNISSAIRVARQKIIAGLLSGNYKKNLGIIGFGPEINILNAVLVAPKLFINEDDAKLSIVGIDAKVEDVLNTIKDFLISTTDGKKSLGILYKNLMGAEYGYGLKKGLVAIYLAVAIMIWFKDHIVITKKDREIPLNATLFNEIDIAPDSYQILLESWDTSKEAYISNLESTFYQYINNEDKIGGSFSYIVKAMRRWYLQLSKFECVTKHTCDRDGEITECSKATIKFRSLLNNPDINAHELLFETLFNCFNTQDPTQVVVGVRQAHKEIGENLLNYKKYILDIVAKLFNAKDGVSISSSMANYYDDLSQATKEHSFSGKYSAFLNIAKNPNNDELKLVEDLARAICNLRLGDFTDEIMSGFIEELNSVKRAIDEYNKNAKNGAISSEGYKISYIDGDGNEVIKQYDAADVTKPQSQYFYNDILSVLEEFGDSLTVDEKRQILFNLLKDLI